MIRPVLSMIFIALLSISLGVNAQQTASPTAANLSADISCHPELKKFLDRETQDYHAFMLKHLQNKKAAGKLMETANLRYLQYRANLLNYRKNLPYLQGIRNPLVAANDVERCQLIIDKYLEAATAFQKRSLIGNAQRKATIRLTERLRNINAKLDTLNKNVGTVKGNLQIFIQKVPCYVERCPPN